MGTCFKIMSCSKFVRGIKRQQGKYFTSDLILIQHFRLILALILTLSIGSVPSDQNNFDNRIECVSLTKDVSAEVSVKMKKIAHLSPKLMLLLIQLPYITLYLMFSFLRSQCQCQTQNKGHRLLYFYTNYNCYTNYILSIIYHKKTANLEAFCSWKANL